MNDRTLKGQIDLPPTYKSYANILRSDGKSPYTKKEVMEKKRRRFDELLRSELGCEKCGRPTNLTLDHIIPVHILADFGFDFLEMYDEENLRLLCKPCNNMKSNHLDFSTPKTKHLLLK